jgi:predicted MFS family arabinose efflux permease
VWARQFAFSTAVLALIFAVYALVLIPALLLFGQLSDRLGRRAVTGIGLGLATVALVLFALATGVAWLFAARAVLGVAQGMLSGAATAALAELVPGGLSIRRPRVPREIRGAFIRIGLTGAAVWAVAAGLFLAVMPSYAGQLVLHTRNLALLALVTALVLVASCAAQLATRHGAPPAQAQAAGLALLAAGLLALVIASPAQSAALLIIGAILAGGGHGVAVLAAQDNLARIAPEGQRAEVSAAFYVCVYLGVAVPVIAIGVLAVVTTLYTAVAAFAAVTGSGALAVAAWHWRNRAQHGEPGQGQTADRTRRVSVTPGT